MTRGSGKDRQIEKKGIATKYRYLVAHYTDHGNIEQHQSKPGRLLTEMGLWKCQ